VQVSAAKICICQFTKRSGLHKVMVIDKNIERRRRADQKSATAAQANYRRRGDISAGL